MTKRRIVQGNLVAIDSPALPPVVYHVCVKCGAPHEGRLAGSGLRPLRSSIW